MGMGNSSGSKTNFKWNNVTDQKYEACLEE